MNKHHFTQIMNGLESQYFYDKAIAEHTAKLYKGADEANLWPFNDFLKNPIIEYLIDTFGSKEAFNFFINVNRFGSLIWPKYFYKGKEVDLSDSEKLYEFLISEK